MPSLTAPKTRNDFRVAIICALPLEANLVESVLDACWENEGQRYGKAAGDENAYTTGMMGGHNVVLVYMPSMGSTSAAAVAVGLRMSFRGVELALVVGICGAVPIHPTTKEEVLLGDCIISTAVVQYDFGRRYPGGFVRKNGIEDTLGRTSPEIQAMISKLTASFSRQRVVRRLGHHLEGLQGQVSGARYPGSDRDRLYEPTYVHRHNLSYEHCEKCLEHVGTCTKDCIELGCNPARLVARHRLGRQADTNRDDAENHFPRLHLGRFGSANTVIKSGEDRDRLAAADQIVAFEMEAAGIWDHLPTIVVKSVCDYADSHKNKEWQCYAAASAAACAKAFLEECMTESQTIAQNQRSSDFTTFVDKSLQSPDTLPKSVWHVPFYHKAGFTGRNDELQRIQQDILQRDNNRITTIVGLGGIGKSRLALELAYLVQAEQTSYSVLWVQATNMSTFENDIRDIGIKLAIPGIHADQADVKALVKQWLSDPDCGPWLLIVDNADDEEIWTRQSGSGNPTALFSYLPQVPHGFVVVTTRSRRVAVCLSGRNIVNLGAPSIEEAYQILVSELGPEHIDLAVDHDLTLTLLDKLACLPLAVVQAASYLNMTQTSIHTYLDLLSGPEPEVIDVLSEDFGDCSRYADARNPVAATWLVSFDHIRVQDPLAATYLSTMACLHNKSIPHSLLPKTESKVAAVKAIGTLTGYSFVTRQTAADTNSGLGDLYDMHPLVHLATRNWLKREGSFEKYVMQSAGWLLRLFPPVAHEYRAIWMTYEPHGEHLCLEPALISVAERYRLMDKLGQCMGRKGKYNQALLLFTKVLEWREVELGRDDDETAVAHYKLGSILLKHGDYMAAEKHLLQAYHRAQKRFGDESLQTLFSQSGLANTYFRQGRYQEARELQVQILEVEMRVLGPEHPDTLKTQANLTGTYFHQGEHQAAEKMQVQVLEAQTRILGPEHPTTLASQSNLATIHAEQGRYQEAEKLQVQVLGTIARVLGPQHPQTLFDQDLLARIYWKQGHTLGAVTLLSHCVDERRRILGEQHPATRSSRKSLEDWQRNFKAAQSSSEWMV